MQYFQTVLITVKSPMVLRHSSGCAKDATAKRPQKLLRWPAVILRTTPQLTLNQIPIEAFIIEKNQIPIEAFIIEKKNQIPIEAFIIERNQIPIEAFIIEKNPIPIEAFIIEKI